jgi:hypothetical protein
MAGLAARTAKSKSVLFRMMMVKVEGEEEMAREREKRRLGSWRI